MPLNLDDLLRASDELKCYLDDRWDAVIAKLNTNGRLEELFELVGYDFNSDDGRTTRPFKDKKIVIIGASRLGKQDLLDTCKEMGFSEERFDLHLDYETVKMKDFIAAYRNNMNCSAILLGPMPHSAKGKGCYSSLISAMRTQEGFAPVRVLGERRGSNNNVVPPKITKSELQNALQELITSGLVDVG